MYERLASDTFAPIAASLFFVVKHPNRTAHFRDLTVFSWSASVGCYDGAGDAS